ncbi:MAG: 2-C-methyl-D-erythritol 4-phosphate cytidylyltransferase [Micrococcales bacterium]|nr:2-C-methyl-D-erythritol 4-phosphate cytidylyltransferase [Micrococcales bacterium]
MAGIAVILVAAGDGTRLGQGIPKSLVKVNGKTLLEHALERIIGIPGLIQIVVASHEDRVEEFAAISNSVIQDLVPAKFTPGGLSRQGSIANALEKVTLEADVVLVHDAARCFTPTELFVSVAKKVIETNHGVVPLLPVADTIKEVSGENVHGTIDRANLRITQTPQGFVYSELVENYKNASADYTDDAALMQAAGVKITAVAGDSRAFKITVPSDLEYAMKLFGGQRTGIGTDVHSFSEDKSKPLYLGTLQWDGEVGLEGHSDGDALSHAIVDALLSAAGLGDIGSNFGVDDDKYAGANGKVFLTETVNRLAEKGWEVINVSVQLIGDRPKVAPMRSKLEQALSEILGAPVSVGATTTDGMGFLADARGVGAVASALIQSRL